MPTPIQLARYDNSWFHPGGSALKRALWFFLGQPIVGASWIPSSSLRVHLLRLFGATIGRGVVIKPSVQIKYPWHLSIADDSWIGEHVWIDNLTAVRIGSNVCISQGVYICTGNHDWTDPAFGLMIAPVQLGDGAWAGAKSILTPGCVLEEGAVAAAGAVIIGTVPRLQIYAGNPATYIKARHVRSTSQPVNISQPAPLRGGAQPSAANDHAEIHT